VPSRLPRLGIDFAAAASRPEAEDVAKFGEAPAALPAHISATRRP